MIQKTNTLIRTLEDNANTLLGWLLKFWRNQCPTLSDEEMMKRVEVGIEGLEEVYMVERRCCCIRLP